MTMLIALFILLPPFSAIYCIKQYWYAEVQLTFLKNFNNLKNPSLITTFSDYLRQAGTAHQNLARSLLANASNLNGAEMGQHARIFHQNLAHALDQIHRQPNRRSPRNYFDRILADHGSVVLYRSN